MTDQQDIHTCLPDAQPIMRIMPMPADANAQGAIFGGWMMMQVDIAGSIEAQRCAQGAVTTVAVNAFQFHQPVHVGDLVSFYVERLRVGKTSITVKVEVFAQRHPDLVNVVKVTEAMLTYVAVDVSGNARELPQLVG
ncbi:acyl-CoA thioesterase [Chitinivorax sp. B]|uniref:acyl-CoA thioesterase n=1 Tax=Chitinivorax sp. B TaxID=2502235 RepID=UPI0010F9CACF|nr:acyl-CoA thioesterase [Chitinivorax sp. B]